VTFIVELDSSVSLLCIQLYDFAQILTV